MGVFRQKVQILNAFDNEKAANGELTKDKVRHLELDMLVDSGAYMLCINEAIKDQLGLRVQDTQEGILANGERQMFDIVGPVEIRIFNRRTVTEAIVLPGNAAPLLGSIPMEALDLIIDPREGALKLPPRQALCSANLDCVRLIPS